jgi:ABC-type Fe3+ transport system substrate-binding protein
MMSGHPVRVAAMAVGLVGLAGAMAHAETMDELYQKAKAEKEVVFYSGGPVAPYEVRAKRFKARFPGIEVKITGGFSNVLDSKINQQIKAGRMEVDMAFLQTVHDYVDWKSQGRLIAFRPDGEEKIDPRFRDPDGMTVTTSVILLSYAYNTKMVPAAEVPKGALDFLKPQFAGKLVTAYPADDDATMFVFYDIVKKHGWDYMKKYMANKPTFIQGHLGVLRSIADGKHAVTFDSTSSTTAALKKAGKPIEFAFPATEAMPVFFITGAIFKGAPHPNAAKLFMTFFLGKDEQSKLGTFSARTDVPPPEGLKPLASYNIDAGYKAFVSDQKAVAEMRARFESYTGPVVNKGGVR